MLVNILSCVTHFTATQACPPSQLTCYAIKQMSHVRVRGPALQSNQRTHSFWSIWVAHILYKIC